MHCCTRVLCTYMYCVGSQSNIVLWQSNTITINQNWTHISMWFKTAAHHALTVNPNVDTICVHILLLLRVNTHVCWSYSAFMHHDPNPISQCNSTLSASYQSISFHICAYVKHTIHIVHTYMCRLISCQRHIQIHNATHVVTWSALHKYVYNMQFVCQMHYVYCVWDIIHVWIIVCGKLDSHVCMPSKHKRHN